MYTAETHRELNSVETVKSSDSDAKITDKITLRM